MSFLNRYLRPCYQGKIKIQPTVFDVIPLLDDEKTKQFLNNIDLLQYTTIYVSGEQQFFNFDDLKQVDDDNYKEIEKRKTQKKVLSKTDLNINYCFLSKDKRLQNNAIDFLENCFTEEDYIKKDLLFKKEEKILGTKHLYDKNSLLKFTYHAAFAGLEGEQLKRYCEILFSGQKSYEAEDPLFLFLSSSFLYEIQEEEFKSKLNLLSDLYLKKTVEKTTNGKIKFIDVVRPLNMNESVFELREKENWLGFMTEDDYYPKNITTLIENFNFRNNKYKDIFKSSLLLTLAEYTYYLKDFKKDNLSNTEKQKNIEVGFSIIERLANDIEKTDFRTLINNIKHKKEPETFLSKLISPISSVKEFSKESNNFVMSNFDVIYSNEKTKRLFKAIQENIFCVYFEENIEFFKNNPVIPQLEENLLSEFYSIRHNNKGAKETFTSRPYNSQELSFLLDFEDEKLPNFFQESNLKQQRFLFLNHLMLKIFNTEKEKNENLIQFNEWEKNFYFENRDYFIDNFSGYIKKQKEKMEKDPKYKTYINNETSYFLNFFNTTEKLFFNKNNCIEKNDVVNFYEKIKKEPFNFSEKFFLTVEINNQEINNNKNDYNNLKKGLRF